MVVGRLLSVWEGGRTNYIACFVFVRCEICSAVVVKVIAISVEACISEVELFCEGLAMTVIR